MGLGIGGWARGLLGKHRAGRLSGGTVATGGDGDGGKRFCAEQLREGLLSSREQ